MRDLGNVIRLRTVTMEAEPRAMELTGEDVLKVMHAYGTNGIITEVEMPLTASYDWIDVIVGFDDFMDAAGFGNDLAIQDGILAKLITPIAAPIPYDYFKRHQKFFRREQSIVVCMIAPHAMDAFDAFVRSSKGEIVFRADQGVDLKGLPPAYELPGTTRRCAPSASTQRSPIYRHAIRRRTISPTSRRWSTASATRCRRISSSSASTAPSARPACRWSASPRPSGWTRSSASMRTMAAGSSTRTATRWKRAA
ncbi:hypothetical protein AJ88_17955 [Mesorhizobium amorphae CCBAU 01583]|nr:hypothetical protein AJ88_17955 [Mesorhizobium amorphae CCBAU 01583]